MTLFFLRCQPFLFRGEFKLPVVFMPVFFAKQINKIITPLLSSEDSPFDDFPVLFTAQNQCLMIWGVDFLEEELNGILMAIILYVKKTC